jgi:hypothetical protein
VVVCAAGVVVLVVARGVADVVVVDCPAVFVAAGVAVEDPGCAPATLAWFATATVPAIVKNDATLKPASSQRVAAAG